MLPDLGQTVLDIVVVAMKKLFRSRLEEQLSVAGSILVVRGELQIWQFILCCSGRLDLQKTYYFDKARKALKSFCVWLSFMRKNVIFNSN